LNQGAAALSWNSVPSQAWVTVSPGSGALSPGTFVQVTVGIDGVTAPATAGTNFENVQFTSTAGSADTTTRAVTLNVTTTAPPPASRSRWTPPRPPAAGEARAGAARPDWSPRSCWRS